MHEAVTIIEPRKQPASANTGQAPERCEVAVLCPERLKEWDIYVRAHADGTLFHTIAWRDAVRDTYGHEDIYLTARRGHAIVGVLPLFFVSSWLAGRILVSVPYGVGGGIIADDDQAAAELFNMARQIAADRRCRALELRSERAVIPGLTTIDRYAGFRRELPERAREVLGWLPRKARAAARNARDKHKLVVSFGDEHLADVWRLYSISMRRLASPNYPMAFFRHLLGGTPNRHWVSLVRWNDRAVAGLVTFLFKDRVMPYFIGTTNAAKRCSAANFIYLTAMERGVASGYRVFDFGRSRWDNTGSFNFKSFQGFEPRPLEYQSYSPPGDTPPNLSPGNPRFRFARKVWSCLPLVATRALGARLARHIPG